MNRYKLSLLIACIATFATCLPASAQLQAGEINLIGIGVGFIGGLLNPPHRATEIAAEAEVRKAKIMANLEIEREKLRIAANADKITPILNRWGVNRVTCAPDLVTINGLDPTGGSVCIQPSETMAAGYYNYDAAKSLLLRTNTSVTQTTQTIRTNNRVTSSQTVTSKGF